MAGHLDTTVSITAGTEVKGMEIKEPLISAIWPNAGSQAATAGVRDYVLATLIIAQKRARVRGAQNAHILRPDVAVF